MGFACLITFGQETGLAAVAQHSSRTLCSFLQLSLELDEVKKLETEIFLLGCETERKIQVSFVCCTLHDFVLFFGSQIFCLEFV